MATSAAGSPATMPRSRYVIDGPRWFRMQIRHRGPLYALAPPLAAGAVALACINLFESQLTGVLGLTLAYFAAPVLPILGAPFSGSDRHPLAIGLSALLWVVVGWIAARRSTRNPMATWSDFWRDYAWLAGGVWLGAVVPMMVARFGIGGQLF
jgi:hypothetical protein